MTALMPPITCMDAPAATKTRMPAARAASSQPRFRAQLLIIASVVLVFGQIIGHQFLAYDDDRTIQFNPWISRPSLENVAHFWRHAYMDLYVPVTYTIWSALSWLGGFMPGAGSVQSPDPVLFHAASLLLHAINALLVFALLKRLIHGLWPALAGALLFAVHPVQVEAVAWASGLKDLLCATFSVAALLQYVVAVAPDPDAGVRRSAHARRVHYALGMLFMTLGMLSKPTAMVTPLLAATIDGLVLGRPWRSVLKSITPWLALAVPCAVWTKLCQPSGFRHAVAFWQRPLIATDALSFYLFKLVFPVHLIYDYGRTPWRVIGEGWAYFTWIAPVTVATLLLVFRKRAAVLAAAGILLVGGLLPVLGLTAFDFQIFSGVADHYLYLAMIGPALALAWTISRVARDRRMIIATTAVLGLFAARAAGQARYWMDDQRFFTHAIQINPNSWGSYFALATDAHNRAIDLAGDHPAAADAALAEAMTLYKRTIQINPNHLGAEHGYAVTLMHFGRLQEAAAVLSDIVRRRDRLPPAGRTQFYRDSDLLALCRAHVSRADPIENGATRKPD